MSDDKKPTEGDQLQCQECGMEVLVTESCKCEDGEPFFSCCGKQMKHERSKS